LPTTATGDATPSCVSRPPPDRRTEATNVPGVTTVAAALLRSAVTIIFDVMPSVLSRKPSPSPSGWPKIAPMTVSVAPVPAPSGTVAANSRQPPALSVEPVLMPITPYWPSSRLKLTMVPSTGICATRVLTIARKLADCIAASASLIWSVAVETVDGSRPEGSV
jgi:hypothetical protein